MKYDGKDTKILEGRLFGICWLPGPLLVPLELPSCCMRAQGQLELFRLWAGGGRCTGWGEEMQVTTHAVRKKK